MLIAYCSKELLLYIKGENGFFLVFCCSPKHGKSQLKVLDRNDILLRHIHRPVFS